MHVCVCGSNASNGRSHHAGLVSVPQVQVEVLKSRQKDKRDMLEQVKKFRKGKGRCICTCSWWANCVLSWSCLLLITGRITL